MAAREQVAFQHSLADVLRQHGVHDPSFWRQVVVLGQDFAAPCAVVHLEQRIEPVGRGLVWSEGAEVLGLLVQLVYVADKGTQHFHVLCLYAAGECHIYAVLTVVWHPKVFKQLATVGMWVCTHPQVAFWWEVEQCFDRHTVFVKKLLGFVAFEPLLDKLYMLWAVGLDRHLMCPPVILNLKAVHFLWTCPPFGCTEHYHRPVRPRGIAFFPGSFLVGEYLLDAEVQGIGKFPVHLGRVAALHKVWCPAAALEKCLKFGMRYAGQHCRVCNLVAV